MPTVKRVMREANPVGNDRTEDQGRADALLADLLRSEPANTRPVARRRALVWGVAGLVAVVAAGVVGVVVWQGAAAPPPEADEPFFATTERLEGRAEAIVRVRLAATRATSQDGIEETVATAEVRKTAKGGPTPGSTLRVFYTPPGSGPETPTGLRQNGEYVLLLEKRDATSWNLVNTTQGYYVVGAAGKLTATPDNPVELSPSTRQLLGVS